MSTTYQQISEAWHSTDPRGELNRSVERLAEFVSLDELDAALGRLLDEVRATGANDETEEIINEVGDRIHGWCHRSNRVTTTHNAALTKKEIVRLPHSSRVAYAARCARRVFPLFKHYWPLAEPPQLRIVEEAIELAEKMAGGASPAGWRPTSVTANLINIADDSRESEQGLASKVVHAARWAALSADEPSDRSAESAYQSVGNAGYAAPDAKGFFRNDFTRLERLIEQHHWTDDTPVPPDVFGPMWPDGPPSGWPIDNDVSTPPTDYWGIITVEPGKRGGQPCVRGMRITVADVLSYLAAGMSYDEVLADFPYLTRGDILACLAFAADRERQRSPAPV